MNYENAPTGAQESCKNAKGGPKKAMRRPGRDPRRLPEEFEERYTLHFLQRDDRARFVLDLRVQQLAPLVEVIDLAVPCGRWILHAPLALPLQLLVRLESSRAQGT